MGETRDHGGNLDAQIARYGGTRETWIDLSTGINPVSYPLPVFTPDCWTALPDSSAQTGLTEAARRFWNVPEGLDILATPGASALISRMPSLFAGNTVDIPQPTYNEHATELWRRTRKWDFDPSHEVSDVDIEGKVSGLALFAGECVLLISSSLIGALSDRLGRRGVFAGALQTPAALSVRLKTPSTCPLGGTATVFLSSPGAITHGA